MNVFGYTHCDEAFVRGEAPLWISMKDGEVVKGGIDLMPVVAVVNDCYLGKLTEGVKPITFVIGCESINSDKISLAVQSGKEKELLFQILCIQFKGIGVFGILPYIGIEY